MQCHERTFLIMRMNKRKFFLAHADRQRGFTLIEAVMVIVITGILGGMVAIFIGGPVRGYIDSADRAELTDAADLALRRMARDIRLALPNSIRVPDDNKHFLELLLTKTGGRYLAEEDDMTGSDILNWNDAGDTSFTVVGAMPTGRQAILPNDYLVVYNLGEGQEPANAYNCTPCNRASILGAPAGNVVTMKANPFASQVPSLTSPSRRFQIVTSAVTYVCDPDQKTLTRYWNYEITAVQPTTIGQLTTQDPNKPVPPGSALLANGVSSCAFDYEGLANTRSGLVGLTIELEVANSNSGKVKLIQQVHVDNTP